MMKTILAVILAFLRPANVFNLPAGQTADATGADGLLGLMQNLNNYVLDMASYATAGTNVNLLAGDIASNPLIQLNTGATGGFTITLPTTSQILGALTGTVPQDGSFTKIVSIVNNNIGQTGTLTAGDTPTSVIGTATIATNTRRDFAMRVLASALTFTNIGSVSL